MMVFHLCQQMNLTTFEFIQGDTVINSVNYKNVNHQSFYTSTYFLNPPNQDVNDTLQSPNIVGFIREDTITQEVYYIDRWMNYPNEELLFDFSLNVGDTLNNPFLLSVTNDTVDSITNLVLLNNDTTRVLHLYNGAFMVGSLETNFTIEGIGGPGGLHRPYAGIFVSGPTGSREIICFQQDSITLFGTCNYPNFYTRVLDIKQSSLISIYPNPTDGHITITLEEASPVTVTVNNSVGQVVHKQSYTTATRHELDLTSPAGLYFLRIVAGDKIITKKVIKK